MAIFLYHIQMPGRIHTGLAILWSLPATASIVGICMLDSCFSVASSVKHTKHLQPVVCFFKVPFWSMNKVSFQLDSEAKQVNAKRAGVMFTQVTLVTEVAHHLSCKCGTHDATDELGALEFVLCI